MRHAFRYAALALALTGWVGCDDAPATPPTPAPAVPDDAPAAAAARQVTVFVAREAQEAGVSVRAATEGTGDERGIEVRLDLAFAKPVEARVLLRAYDGDNVELGRAKSRNLDQIAGSALAVSVYFRHDLRLDRIHHCGMELIPQKAVALSGDGAGPPELIRGKDKEPPALRLGRMLEDAGPPIRARLGVLFDTSFAGELQLRAHDLRGTEVGRSQRIDGVEAEAGASRTFEFRFHETLSADSVESYELFVRGTRAPKVKKRR
jgi:hypothetical protein